MKQSTTKALTISAMALYVIGALVAIAVLPTGNLNLMVIVPAVFFVGVVLHCIPEANANRAFNRY